MDRRQRKSREAIFSAFSSLLEKKSYSSITVQDIIDKADVGRSTFYAHFQTKDLLLKEMCREIFEHVFSSEIMTEEKHDFSKHKTFLDRLTHILYHLQEKQEHIKGLYRGECGDIFFLNLKEYLARVFDSRIKSNESVPHDYCLDITVSSFAESIRWWLEQNDKYSPEEITAFYAKSISTFLKE